MEQQKGVKIAVIGTGMVEKEDALRNSAQILKQAIQQAGF